MAETDEVVYISCEEGVHQGDPLGPVFFSMGLAEVMEEAKREMGKIGVKIHHLPNDTNAAPNPTTPPATSQPGTSHPTST